MRRKTKWLVRGLLAVVFGPMALMLLVGVLLYLPPVQNYVVQQTTALLSGSTGMRIGIGRVRLTFPLNLVIDDVLVADGADTLLTARRLWAEAVPWPLVRGIADVKGVGVWRGRLDTHTLIADARVAGSVGRLYVRTGRVNLRHDTVDVRRLLLEKSHLAIHLSDTARTDTTPSAPTPWVICLAEGQITDSRVALSLPGDSLRLNVGLERLTLTDAVAAPGADSYGGRRFYWQGDAACDVPGTDTLAGLDPNHLHLRRLRLQVDTFRYDAAGLAACLAGLEMEERSGLRLEHMTARVACDTTRLQLPALTVQTAHSRLQGRARIDFAALRPGGRGRAEATLRATLGNGDLRAVGNLLPEGVAERLPREALTLALEVAGNEERWQLNTLEAHWPGIARLQAGGRAARLTEAERRNGTLQVNLHTGDLSFAKQWLDTATARRIDLTQPLTLDGRVAFRATAYETDLHLAAGAGNIHLFGDYDTRRERYEVRSRISDFPLQAFLPHDSLFDLSARLSLTGHGFDVFSPHTQFEGAVSIDRFRYTTWNLDSIRLGAWLDGGRGTARMESANDVLQGATTVEADFTPHDVRATFGATMDYINLQKLTAGRDSVGLTLALDGRAYADRALTDYGVEGSFSRLFVCVRGGKRVPAKDLDFAFATSPDTTRARLAAGDLTLRLAARGHLDDMLGRFGALSDTVARQMAVRHLDTDTLKGLLPEMRLFVVSGKDNPISNLLKYRGYEINRLALDVTTDPRQGLNGEGSIYSLSTGGILIDTIGLHLFQDSGGLRADVKVNNATKYNPHKFTARAETVVTPRGARLEVYFRDSDGREGMRVGMRADMAPGGGFNLSLYPKNPIIAFRNFEVNDSNYVYLAPGKPIRADVDLLADDGTALRVYTASTDSVQDISINIARLNLDELTALFPFSPNIGGFLDTDVHLTEENKRLSAVAHAEVEALAYESVPLGDIGLDAVYFPLERQEHHVNAVMYRGGNEVMTVDGTYAEKTDSLDAELDMTRFPLDMLNGFMGDLMGLAGYANGTFSLGGPAAQPLLSGTVALDSAYFYSLPYGLNFRFEDRPLEIAKSRLQFSNFNFYSGGSAPLTFNGEIDFSRLEEITLDIAMNAEDFELINAPRTDESLVFGKVYADYRGNLHGNTDNLVVRGLLQIQDRTDVTYILKDTPLSVEDQLSDLVQFVDFGDTLQTVKERPAPLGLDMTLAINISTAAQARCELSADGASYVDVEGGGELSMRYTPLGELRMTGRYTIYNGEMKYELPVIPLKTFELVSGSYVEFTGDVYNPTLNIAAKERVKAAVTENDATRNVAFDVGIAITKPLDQMGLEFTLEAPEDASVQNQLTAMSREDRAKLAVSMLATGMYLMEGNTSSFKTNNALNAFLQSEIRNIAGNALKTVDVSINVEDGTTATGETHTDYSFRFAKRFWGNRVSFIIGGKVTSGNNPEEHNESFIDNVSLEYRLDESATRYVRLFYDHNTTDPLEGELTEMGAGLVLRRKTNNLGELFIFRNSKKKPKTEEP